MPTKDELLILVLVFGALFVASGLLDHLHLS